MSLADARCLVLGAGGFIGINLTRELVAAGAVVTAFGRRPRESCDLSSTVPWVEAEFADVDRLASAVAGQDVVFHLLGASLPAQSNEQPWADVADSLLPSVRLIEACRVAGVRRLVFASSGGTVYGPRSGPGSYEPISETEPTDPITAYGINKLAVEKYLGLYRYLHGFDPIVLRIANPYGPHQNGHRPQGMIGAAIARALAGEPITVWGDGSVVRDYLHVQDVAQAMIAAACYRGHEWIFNVGAGEGRSVTQVVECVRRLTGISGGLIRYRAARSADTPYNVLNIRLIGREIGWSPQIPFDRGMAATVAWWRARV